MLPFVGCILLFCFHYVSPQPLEFHNSRALANLIGDDYPSEHRLISSHRIHKEAKHAERKNSLFDALPSNYADITRCINDTKISAYKLHRDTKTWEEARISCYYEGGYLAYPECAEEGKRFHNILKLTSAGSAWIGMHDLYEEGEWLTEFDKNVEELDYVNWAENEPNNYGDVEEDCAVLDVDGKWRAKSCNRKLSYFCKIDLV